MWAKNDLPVTAKQWQGQPFEPPKAVAVILQLMQHSFFHLAATRVWLVQQASTSPIDPVLSNCKVAAVISCCNPLSGHNNAVPTIQNARERTDRWTQVIDWKVANVSPRIQTCHLWSWKIWPNSVCFLRWVQCSAIWLQDFRIRILRTSEQIQLSFTGILNLSCTLYAIQILCVQETTTTSSWSPHCMEMTRIVHIWLWNRNRIECIFRFSEKNTRSIKIVAGYKIIINGRIRSIGQPTEKLSSILNTCLGFF